MSTYELTPEDKKDIIKRIKSIYDEAPEQGDIFGFMMQSAIKCVQLVILDQKIPEYQTAITKDSESVTEFCRSLQDYMGIATSAILEENNRTQTSEDPSKKDLIQEAKDILHEL